MQLCRRTDHVETRSPPYVCALIVASIDADPADPETWTRPRGSRRRRTTPSTRTIASCPKTSPAGSPRSTIRRSSSPRRTGASSETPGWRSSAGGRPGGARARARAEHRNRGVGSALFEAISAAARERGHTHVEARVRETAPEGLEFALHRGFEEIGREFGLELDLTAIEAPEVVPPPGVEIVTWAERPELIRGIYEVASEAYPDVPGEEENRMAPFEDWLVADMGGTGDRPEATFVAVADGEVVGYAKFSLTDAQPTTAYHDMTGVRRSWRGRGIARALKAAELRWAKEQGYERLRTQNEERNTPIRRLNERFGYRPAPGRILLRGPSAADGDPPGAARAPRRCAPDRERLRQPRELGPARLPRPRAPGTRAVGGGRARATSSGSRVCCDAGSSSTSTTCSSGRAGSARASAAACSRRRSPSRACGRPPPRRTSARCRSTRASGCGRSRLCSISSARSTGRRGRARPGRGRPAPDRPGQLRLLASRGHGLVRGRAWTAVRPAGHASCSPRRRRRPRVRRSSSGEDRPARAASGGAAAARGGFRVADRTRTSSGSTLGARALLPGARAG